MVILKKMLKEKKYPESKYEKKTLRLIKFKKKSKKTSYLTSNKNLYLTTLVVEILFTLSHVMDIKGFSI
jgi:hypothetical protein